MPNSPITFSKLISGGMDFIVLDARRDLKFDMHYFASLACHRFKGIGGQALIFIQTSTLADFKITAYNTNGAYNLGDNGLCSAASFIYHNDFVPLSNRRFSIETSHQVYNAESIGKGERIRLEIGTPVFDGHLIPTATDGEQLNKTINVDGNSQVISAVGLDRPHCVLFVTGIDYIDIKKLGNQLENHVYFPKGCIVNFAEAANSELIKLRCWKNGEESVSALGYSSCAVSVVAIKLGLVTPKLIVKSTYSESEVLWENNMNPVYITENVNYVFHGKIAPIEFMQGENNWVIN